jgi:hypothetical protein
MRAMGALLAAGIAFAACSGGGNVERDAGDSATVCNGPSVSLAPMRRLTKSEYAFTLSDGFGLPIGVADPLPDEPTGGDGYDNEAVHAHIDQLRADELFAIAEGAARELANSGTVALPCALPQLDDACIDGFVRSAGRRLFRRALSLDEVTRFRDLFHQADDAVPNHRIALVIEAMLVSPQFLFRPEVADEASAGKVIALNGHEVATRLSYLIWASAPDEELLDAAGNGELDDRDGVAKHARRLLAHPRARRGLAHFFEQWLGTSAMTAMVRDESLYPGFDGALLASMRTQVREYVATTVLDRQGSIADLLTATRAPIDAKIAPLYGVPPPPGNEWRETSLPSDQRKGILTLAAWLTKHGFAKLPATFRRGKFVKVRLLCDDLPPPAADADLSPVELEPNMTNRQALEKRLQQSPACLGCHAAFSDFGYAFESFDSIGRHRISELNGAPLDLKGSAKGTADIDGAFSSWSDLVDKLAASKDVSDCMTAQLYRYGHGRRPSEEDRCELARLEQRKHPPLVEVIVEIVTGDGFRFRRLEPKGG